MTVLEINSVSMFEEEISKDFPIIIDFWASWCGPCRMMIPIFDKASLDFEGRLKFAKVNTETQDGQEIASNQSIRGIPCLIIYKNGKEIDRLVGYKPEHILKADIENVLSKN